MLQQKVFSRYKKPLTKYPNLVENQLLSFEKFLKDDLTRLFKEFTPIGDYSGKKFELEFKSLDIGTPKYDEHYAKEMKLTYDAPVRANVVLHNKTLGTSKEQEIFVTDMPMMTPHGTFITSGIERVVIPQLIRSFGIIFTENTVRGRRQFGAKVIPARGVWVEIEIDPTEVLYARIDRKRKFPVSMLLRAMAHIDGDEGLLKLVEHDELLTRYMKATIAKEKHKGAQESCIEIYKRVREGDVVAPAQAQEFMEAMFSEERYDISEVGRYRFNQRFDKPLTKTELARRAFDINDLIVTLSHMCELQENPEAQADDIDHLGSRRVRYVGEQLELAVRKALGQMKRNIQDRMSTIDVETTLPMKLLSTRPFQARVKEFFTTNQMSQFMAQDNVVAEVEHLRTVSALGPGGLTRERAGFEVRDVHPSHYGRLCPIQTPEGPNIGLVLRLSSYAKVNDYGMIEAPYAKVENGVVTSKVEYFNAHHEERFKIAHAATPYDDKGKITVDLVDVRYKGKPTKVSVDQVEYIDVATNQALSMVTSMIPFVNHDDANRALMGSNMQKQAVPCLIPEAPIVATGVEAAAVKDSGRVIVASNEGIVSYVDGRKIEITKKDGKKDVYNLITFSQTNASTVFSQRPSVDIGDKVSKGQVIADTSSSAYGGAAIGQNIKIAFMTWNGHNFEDAIIISERLVKQNKFSSIHIEEFVVVVRDTKLGPEVTTYDIPNVSEAKLKNLDEDGIIRVGADVRPGDILVGKITPKGESQLTPEERLLRSIFGDKARDVKDTSKRLENGKRGRVIGVQIFSREKGDVLESGIIKRIHVQVAQIRDISVGDKLAGRHGNKGVISVVLPEEDMPYMENGEPVDMILTPLGVPSRMNLGQILELHLGLAAHTLGYQAIVPPFIGATRDEIEGELEAAGYPKTGKVPLYDGRTGEKFEQDIAVGYMYMLKLHHMVEDKIHQRSIGPYSLITQQPLGGKSQNGGQRFGEMEVWALLGYGAAYTLREMLTVKSDDILGRSAAYDAIVKGRPITQTNIPASFNVLLNTLRALSLDVQLVRHDDEEENYSK